MQPLIFAYEKVKFQCDVLKDWFYIQRHNDFQ
jgi:hypothetical protein